MAVRFVEAILGPGLSRRGRCWRKGGPGEAQQANAKKVEAVPVEKL
jgi:hypothetical protein